MTRKKRIRKLGKEIRKVTGIKLPVAMMAAKLIVQERHFDLQYHETTRADVHQLPFWCGWECCGGSGKFQLVGPKGIYKVN